MAKAERSEKNEVVVLLHGLGHPRLSMSRMGRALSKEGYAVVNLGYPSRKHTIEQLATELRERIAERTAGAERIHFVTHSMGGIVLRQVQKSDPLPNIGRVVMLGPPNNGSQIADKLGVWKLLGWWNGPGARQLGSKAGFVETLGSVEFECGVIAGTRHWEPFLSKLVPEPSDGRVSVESARVEGMADFIALPCEHTTLLFKRVSVRQVIAFLRDGRFSR